MLLFFFFLFFFLKKTLQSHTRTPHSLFTLQSHPCDFKTNLTPPSTVSLPQEPYAFLNSLTLPSSTLRVTSAISTSTVLLPSLSSLGCAKERQLSLSSSRGVGEDKSYCIDTPGMFNFYTTLLLSLLVELRDLKKL